MTSRDLKGVVR